ncbi:response regulator [Burkholderia cenocepacia]|uniref:response regulator n=1 Tax=Burkholderia cenocepacia TaxID=95486 RepID=UPI00209BA3CD|nr:response regulator [Burkholderia cenocepacia]
MHDKTVCIIDDELAMRQSLESLVRSMGVRARLYASAEAFLEHGASGTSHCIVCDIQMAGMSGIELLAVLRGGGVLRRADHLRDRAPERAPGARGETARRIVRAGEAL